MSTATFNWSRRGFVRSLTAGSAVLPALIRELLAADGSVAADLLAPRSPHFAPKAKRVIFLYFSGGVSHVDAWDPKPRLFADHGKPMQVDDPQAAAIGAYTNGVVKRPLWEFRKRGESGIEVSDLFPHIG
ncbi:MAG: DUF1501 domain-containing protein, partial [Planctomycetaceae bacterium]